MRSTSVVASLFLGLVGVLSVGCGTSRTSAVSPLSPSESAVGTTFLTSGNASRQTTKAVLPHVSFDDETRSLSEPQALETWGASNDAYPGFDPEIGF